MTNKPEPYLVSFSQRGKRKTCQELKRNLVQKTKGKKKVNNNKTKKGY